MGTGINTVTVGAVPERTPVPAFKDKKLGRGFDVPDGGVDTDIPDVDGSEGTEEGASPISGAEAAPAGGHPQ